MSEPGESHRYWREQQSQHSRLVSCTGKSSLTGHLSGDRQSYLFKVTRQLTRGEERAFDGFVDLVDEEHGAEADPHETHGVQDDHPPHGRTCGAGARHEQRRRHVRSFNTFISRLAKPSNRHFTFRLNAEWRGEVALLQEVLVASLDLHTVPGPRLQGRQSHQVGTAVQVLGL